MKRVLQSLFLLAIVFLTLLLGSCGKKYTVTFHTNGGSAVDPQTVKEGGTVEDPGQPVRPGYEFAGWTVNGKTENSLDGITVNGDLTVEAKWEPVSYTVRYDTPYTEGESQKISFDGSVDYSMFTAEGYVCSGITDQSGNPVNDGDKYTLPDDQKFTVTWTPIVYHVSFVSDREVIAVSEYTVENRDVEIPTPEKEGHTFSHWLSGGSRWIGNDRYASGDYSVQAVWNPNGYTVSFNGLLAYEYGDPISFYVTYGEPFDYPRNYLPLTDGYEVVGFTYEGKEVDFTKYTYPKNITVEPIKRPKTYTVVYHDLNGAEIAQKHYDVEKGFCEGEAEPVVKDGITYGWCWESRDYTKDVLSRKPCVFFGSYEQDGDRDNGKEAIEWQVLTVENGKALLVSDKVLAFRQFNTANASQMTWAECSLRDWLNHAFYAEAFSESDQAAIQTVTNTSSESEAYSYSCQDTVFVPSLTELKLYYSSDAKRVCNVTTYAKLQLSLDSGKEWDPNDEFFNSYNLRSRTKGFISGTLDFINNKTGGKKGSPEIYHWMGVRPAVWVDVEALGR